MKEKFLLRLKTIYSFNSQLRKIISRLSNSRLYFLLLRLVIKVKSKKDLNQGPINLIIENSNFCNAACSFCPYKTMKRTKRIMEQRTFDQIVRRIKEFKLPINKVFLSGMGEPFLDQSIVQRIKTLKGLGLYLKIYTNASVLTKNICQKLIEFKVDELNISFNGADKASYQKVMRLNFDKTLANINQLIKLKEKNNTSLPKIRISMVLAKKNEAGVKNYLENWQNKVDSVTVSLAHQWGGGVRVKSKNRFLKQKITYPCRSLWHTVVVDSSGNYVICCRDYESKFVLGHVFNHAIDEIRNSKFIKEFRQKHLRFNQDSLPKICKSCNFPFQNGVEWLVSREID